MVITMAFSGAFWTALFVLVSFIVQLRVYIVLGINTVDCSCQNFSKTQKFTVKWPVDSEYYVWG